VNRAQLFQSSFALLALGCAVNSDSVPSIVTSGTGQLKLPPNAAAVTISVETRGRSAALATAANTPIVRRVQEALQSLGFAPDSNQTVTFEVEPAYDYQAGNRLVGYDATTSLVLRFRALDQLPAILDGALSAGASRISEIDFFSDSTEAGRRRAFTSAVTNARLDAAAIATAAGGRIGRLLKVTTGREFSSEPMRLEEIVVSRGAAAAPAAIPNIRREVIVSVNVQAMWEFVPAR
jgi:uncharacterized protein